MENKPKLTTWLSLASPIVAFAIYLTVIGVLEIGAIIGIAFLFILFLINKFSPWKYYSWGNPGNENDINLKKGVTLAHNIVTFTLLFTCVLWLFEEWNCAKMPDWFHQHCISLLNEPEHHTLQEAAYKTENKAVKDNVATNLPDGESYSGAVRGGSLMLISSKEMVKLAIEPACRYFVSFPVTVMFLTFITFIGLFLTELISDGRFVNREATG